MDHTGIHGGQSDRVMVWARRVAESSGRWVGFPIDGLRQAAFTTKAETRLAAYGLRARAR